MRVIPSIDVDDIQAFSDQIKRLLPYYQRFQIDIADGALVPFKSVNLPEALDALKQFPTIKTDFHLMVTEPHTSIKLIEDSPLLSQTPIVFIHHKVKPDPSLFSKNQRPYEVGLVLNPEDSVDTIQQTYDLQNIQNIQIMTVHPGPQGSPFLPDMLNKIEQLRNVGYRSKIFLDGGVNEKTVPMILNKQFRPDFVCPGSFFSRAENLEERVRTISEQLDAS